MLLGVHEGALSLLKMRALYRIAWASEFLFYKPQYGLHLS